MSLIIEDDEAERLARQVAKEADETVTEAVAGALRERLARLRAPRAADLRLAVVLELAEQCARLPDLDPRSRVEILGHDEKGAP